MNKIRLLVVVFTILCGMSFSKNIEATSIVYEEVGNTYGCEASTKEDIEEYDEIIECGNYNYRLKSSLPSSVDLSASKYFPEIKNQAQMPSCAAFAGDIISSHTKKIR